MNGFRRWCRGYTCLELTGAMPERCLNRFTKESISFWKVEYQGDLKLRCVVYAADRKRAEAAALRELCDTRVLAAGGFRYRCRGLLKRPVVVLGIVLSVALALFLQNFVWVLQVSGNENIPTQRILRELSEMGIRFGSWGPALDTQVVKNHMLNRIPDLSWLAVNRSGGVLSVLVTERTQKQTATDRLQTAHVVAACDGVITAMSVLNGYTAVKPGQAVTEGQVLVSGYMDLEGHIFRTRAIAEVYAMTMHKKQVLIPLTYEEKVYTGRTYTHVSLVLGRKRIKISGNSRISMGSCDKMMRREVFTLPGGFSFPAVLEIETYREYELQQRMLTAKAAESLLTAYYTAYVKEAMIAGRITGQSFHLTKEKTGYVLTAVLDCEEMIARTIPPYTIGEDEAFGADYQCGEN